MSSYGAFFFFGYILIKRNMCSILQGIAAKKTLNIYSEIYLPNPEISIIQTTERRNITGGISLHGLLITLGTLLGDQNIAFMKEKKKKKKRKKTKMAIAQGIPEAQCLSQSSSKLLIDKHLV